MNKRLVVVLLGLGLVLGGCSSEASPEEKRNNFDKCVLDYLGDPEVRKQIRIYPDSRERYEDFGKQNCRGELE